jgi:hypothetical protein
VFGLGALLIELTPTLGALLVGLAPELLSIEVALGITACALHDPDDDGGALLNDCLTSLLVEADDLLDDFDARRSCVAYKLTGK